MYLSKRDRVSACVRKSGTIIRLQISSESENTSHLVEGLGLGFGISGLVSKREAFSVQKGVYRVENVECNVRKGECNVKKGVCSVKTGDWMVDTGACSVRKGAYSVKARSSDSRSAARARTRPTW